MVLWIFILLIYLRKFLLFLITSLNIMIVIIVVQLFSQIV